MVYDRIDGIKVAAAGGHGAGRRRGLPEAAAAVRGGRRSHNGPDGKPDTTDDLTLGSVDVKWKLEEYTATFGDDDLQFVGALDATTGCSRRTSTARTRSAAATATTSATSGSSPSCAAAGGAAKPLRARAHLLVTVPVYMNWFNLGGGTMMHAGRTRAPSLRGGGPAVRLPRAERGDLRARRRGRRRSCGRSTERPQHARRADRRAVAAARTRRSSTTTIDELARVRAIGEVAAPPQPQPKIFR